MTTTTKKTIVERAAATVGAGEEPINFVTTSGPDSSSVVSTSANFRKTAATAYNGRVALVTETTDGNPPVGQGRVVTSFASGTGDLTTNAFSASLTTADEITLLPRGLGVTDMDEAIDDVTRTLHLPRYLAATLVVDGNFTAADPATGWADIAGTPTQTAETTIVLTGLQSMKVVYTVVDTSVGCATIPVVEGELLLVWAAVKCTAGSVRLQLYDNTNGQEIDGVTVDEEAWVVPILQSAVIPSGCQNVTVRFVNKTAATTCYVDHVGLLSQERELYDVIPEITDAAQIRRALYMPLGYAIQGPNQAYVWGEELEMWPGGNSLRDYFAKVPQRANLKKPTSYPIFWEFMLPDTVMTAMTSTVYLDGDILEAVIDGVVSGCYKRLAAQEFAAGNDDRGFAYKMQQRQHGRAYRALLDKLDLLRPLPGRTAIKRVSAGLRW